MSAHPVAVAREELGLTREELADKAGVATFTLERIETGLTRNPQERTLNAIAEALGIEAHRLERQIVIHRGRATA